MFVVKTICCDRNYTCDSLSESFHFRHVLQTPPDGSGANPRSMLNKAILDPWQRSPFSSEHPRKLASSSREYMNMLVHEIFAFEMLIERIFEVFSIYFQR